MAWISSKEFANRFSLNKKSLEKACFRANLKNKKICSLKSIIINFSYSSGIGGYSGKILQIWDTPLSEAQAQAIEKGYPFEYVLEMEKATTESTNIISEDYHTSTLNKSSNKTTAMTSVEVSAVDLKAKSEAQQSNTLSHSDEVVKSHKKHSLISLISLTPNQKSQALSRELILQEYESAKLNGMKVSHFITLKNREDSTLKLTQGKLFDWARKYKEQGLVGLADKRGVAKIGSSKLPAWAKEEVLNLYRQMGSGYCNRMQIWREVHMRAYEYMDFNYEKFLKCEIPPLFSLNSMNLYLDRYLKENSLEHSLITYGSDKTDSYREPAYGTKRELYIAPNELWQMDSSPLDAIVLDEDSKQMRPHFISIVDVYSGRSVGGIATTSDSNAVVRILWKAFNAMGKPKAIQFDNGKDYLSKKVQGLIAGLGIAYVRSAAYKGKAKAVVERRFRTIQGSYIAALNGYIERNTGERSIIEQQVAKREREEAKIF